MSGLVDLGSLVTALEQYYVLMMIIRVGFPGQSRGWNADPEEMERVQEFKIGDWACIRPFLTSTKYGLGSVTLGSIGIVYCIRPDSSLLIELSYLPTSWHCEPEEVEHVVPFMIGDRICVKRSVAEPRYAWGGETHHSVGKIREIEDLFSIQRSSNKTMIISSYYWTVD
ncbi:hypothetical protein JHK87_043341 [Glycine soja]|nr:hypothetical protein JHK87_043341 [Glycine soja]